MLANQWEKLRKQRDGSRRRSGLAAANRKGLAAGGEVDIGNGQPVSLGDPDTRVSQQPHDGAVLMRAIRVENRAIFVRSREWFGRCEHGGASIVRMGFRRGNHRFRRGVGLSGAQKKTRRTPIVPLTVAAFGEVAVPRLKRRIPVG